MSNYLLLMTCVLVLVVMWKVEKDLVTSKVTKVLHVMNPTQTDLPRPLVTRRSEVKEALGW